MGGPGGERGEPQPAPLSMPQPNGFCASAPLLVPRQLRCLRCSVVSGRPTSLSRSRSFLLHCAPSLLLSLCKVCVQFVGARFVAGALIRTRDTEARSLLKK